MRVAIRGWANGQKVFEDLANFDGQDDQDQYIERLATKHAEAVPTPHMIEIEFLDEPDPGLRFLRFGDDPQGMVMPTPMELSDDAEELERQIERIRHPHPEHDRCHERCPRCAGRCRGIYDHLAETAGSGADLHGCDHGHVWHHGAQQVGR